LCDFVLIVAEKFNFNRAHLCLYLIIKSVKEERYSESPEKKAPAPRPSRAKAKPEPEPEAEEDEDEDLLGEEAEDEDEQGITEDDVKAMLAQKVATNRDVIVKKLKSYGASKISELESSSYKDFYDFMAKLK